MLRDQKSEFVVKNHTPNRISYWLQLIVQRRRFDDFPFHLQFVEDLLPRLHLLVRISFLSPSAGWHHRTSNRQSAVAAYKNNLRIGLNATIGLSPLRFAESTKPPTLVGRQPVDSEPAFFETIRSFSLFPLTTTLPSLLTMDVVAGYTQAVPEAGLKRERQSGSGGITRRSG